MDTELILDKITQWLLQLYKTSNPYFVADYQGEPFQIFDTNHLAALGSILFIILLLVLSRKKMANKNKENIRDTIAAILIVNEIVWHLWAYFYDTWTLQKMLPLHVCSILVWLSAHQQKLPHLRVCLLSWNRRRAAICPHARCRHLWLSPFSLLSNLHLTRIDHHRRHLHDRHRKNAPHLEIHHPRICLLQHLHGHCLWH